ncbi:MAG: outer membrane beta-barrel protein [Bacteroidetes bacterium]|nr:outer membrane beta-barrel protein [Bacteroidota bacterium]
MKKILVGLFLLLGSTAFAQGISVGVDGGYGVPQGDFGDAYSGGGGAELRARFYPMDKLHLGLNTGFYVYPSASTVNGQALSVEGTTSIIPITAGIEYYFFDKIVKPYIGLDFGLYMSSVKSTVEVLNTKTTTTKSDNNFGIAPNAGVMFGLSPVTNLNIGVKYPTIFSEDSNGDSQTNSILLFQVGFHFKFGL